MRNLILYGTTYGYTGKCAQELAKKLNNATDCIDIKNSAKLDLSQYDTIIMGSSVYMGQMNKGIKNIIQSQAECLKNKRLGFFVCCASPELAEKHFESNFPKELLERAVAKECFGGEMDITKMGFFHKFITKMVKKAGEKEGKKDPQPIPENIDKMAQALNIA